MINNHYKPIFFPNYLLATYNKKPHFAQLK